VEIQGGNVVLARIKRGSFTGWRGTKCRFYKSHVFDSGAGGLCPQLKPSMAGAPRNRPHVMYSMPTWAQMRDGSKYNCVEV